MKIDLYKTALKSFVTNNRGRSGLSGGLVMATILISISIAIFIVTISLFDGFKRGIEDLLLSTTPQLLVKKKISDQAIGIFTNEDIKDFKKSQSSLSGGNKIIDDYSPDERWYLIDKEEKKVFSDKELISEKKVNDLNQSLSSIKEIEYIEELLIERLDLTIRHCNKATKNKYPVLIIGANFDSLVSTLSLINIYKNKFSQASKTNSSAIVSEKLYQIIEKSELNENECSIISVDSINENQQIKINISSSVQVGFGGSELSVLVLPIATAKKLLNISNDMSLSLGIKVKDKYQTKKIVNLIQEKNIKDIALLDWQEISKRTFTNLAILRIITQVILYMIVIVSCFSLRSALLVLIQDKRHQINIFMALGLRRKEVLFLFLFIGLLMGVLGTVVGIFAGVSMADVLSNIQLSAINSFLGTDSFTFSFSYHTIFSLVSISALIAIVFSIGPARSASSTEIATGIRA